MKCEKSVLFRHCCTSRFIFYCVIIPRALFCFSHLHNNINHGAPWGERRDLLCRFSLCIGQVAANFLISSWRCIRETPSRAGNSPWGGEMGQVEAIETEIEISFSSSGRIDFGFHCLFLFIRGSRQGLQYTKQKRKRNEKKIGTREERISCDKENQNVDVCVPKD